MRKSSFFDDLVYLPWWVSLLIGGAVYLLLKYVLPGIETANAIQSTIYKTLSSLAGIIALLFVMTAAFAALRQLKSGDLFRQQAKVLNLKSISWQQFEQLIREAYRRKGYQVSGNTRGGADGGIDLVLRKADEKTLVQCKHWQSSKVGVAVVRELYGVVTKDQADRGIVVCSGVFTVDAIAFAKGLPMELIDGADLKRLIVLPEAARKQSPVCNPLCPVCNSDMVMRKASKGRYAGQNFMGCKRFPKCRGTRKV